MRASDKLFNSLTWCTFHITFKSKNSAWKWEAENREYKLNKYIKNPDMPAKNCLKIFDGMQLTDKSFDRDRKMVKLPTPTKPTSQKLKHIRLTSGELLSNELRAVGSVSS